MACVNLADLDECLKSLFNQAASNLKSKFNCDPTHAAFAPGRVNLIGEHTDYNAGFVFPMALPQATVIVCCKTSDSNTIQVTSSAEGVASCDHTSFFVPSEASPLTPGEPAWANYVKGVIAHYPGEVGGFSASAASSVPLGGGLSSSASLEVAMFTALESMFPVSVTPVEKALVCQKAEHTFANMPCGIMDQFISTMGQKDHALLIDCETNEGRQVPLELPGKCFLVINSNVKHELTGSEYPERRSNCVKGAETLSVTSLRHASLDQLMAKKAEMDDTMFRRAHHVITEIQRCTSAVAALDKGDSAQFGGLMVQSHNSLRDDFEVSCPALNELVDIATSVPGVDGSRMTGGGFGGCTVTLCDQTAVPNVMQAVKERYSGNASFIRCTASSGARIIQL